ncbi:hypothetical protein [Clostridium magnum]|nr:hypothetical protein [Clostridium magnum]
MKVGDNMDFQEILYQLKKNRLGKKAVKLIFTGCLFMMIIFIILIIIAMILAVKYHTQIFDGLMRIFNYVFGDSPNNVISGYVKQIIDNFIKDLFNKN